MNLVGMNWHIEDGCSHADCDTKNPHAAAPTWCKTTQIDDDLQICLPAAANTTILQQAWGQGIAGFRDASDFIERNCNTPSSWVSDIFM